MVERWVYFIRPIGQEGPVKIGCSQVPEDRLRHYLPWCPYPLEIAVKVRGGFSLEAQFHAAFSNTHLHHEWFGPSAELSRAIGELIGGSFDYATLPSDVRPLGHRNRPPATAEFRAGMGLAHRLRHAQDATGLRAPASVEAAARDARSTIGAEHDRCVKVVELYLANPIAHGELIHASWAYAANSAYRQRQGLPPIRSAA